MPFRKNRPIFKKKAREQRKKIRSRKIKQAMTFSIVMIIILASHNVFGVHLLFNEMIPPTEVVKGEKTFSTSGLWPQIKINKNGTWNKSTAWRFNFDDKISSSIPSSETSSYSEEELVPSKMLPNGPLHQNYFKHLPMDDDQC
ncbi:hypothetical protein Ocin01_05728 [Orchesella cincta]|uniref:Uncharacterized protein n=1 Tax=Orchesella cincta TaxID=48709 RepID=A0A1D2N6S3_ORCCI|nr:hypothetical protein Ocin01_05728 [Orchesella cincta]